MLYGAEVSPILAPPIPAPTITTAEPTPPHATASAPVTSGADEVQHDRRTAPARQGLDLLGSLGVGGEHLVGAVVPGEVELGGSDVQRDDAGRGELTEQLDGDVSEPTSADDHGGRAPDESRQHTLDRLVRRERCVGERGRTNGIQIPDGTDDGGCRRPCTPPSRRACPVLGEIIPVRHRFSEPSAHISHTPHPQQP